MSEKRIPPPQMRNLVFNASKKHIVISLVLATIAGVAWKYGHTEPLRKRYEHFYRTYDTDKAAEDMLKAGIFQAFPDGKV